jgi:putative membrane protein
MRRSAGLTLSCIALLALAACSWFSKSEPEPPPAPPAPVAAQPQGPPPGTDQQFVDIATAGELAEIDLSRLAAKKGHHHLVRLFGEHMAAEHTQSKNRLLAVAHQVNITTSAANDSQEQAVRDQLASLSGANFDRQYISGQIKGHQDMVKLFETEAQAGESEQLRAFAKGMLPKLRQQLHRAAGVAKDVGT